VFDTTFKRIAQNQPGYLEAFETVIGSSKIQFTPQKKFFDTTKDWAVALQDIYGGDDAATRLRSLAKTNTSKVNL
jgi:multiple sugar transport system substrate-binding protein